MKTKPDQLLSLLEDRRRALGLTHAAVAAMSGVSPPTVYRTLAEFNPHASWSNVLAIADALGLDATFQPRLSVQEMRHQKAAQKAIALTRQIQSTSALEAQAVSAEQIDQMREQTIHELLAGSNHTLWAK